MLLPTFFIIDCKKYQQLPDINLPENSYMCYRITNDLLNQVGSFHKDMLLTPNRNYFCLLINIDNESGGTDADFNEVIDNLVSFSFHINYMKFNNDNPLVIFETKMKDINKYIDITRETFTSQGFNDVEIKVLRNPGIPVLTEKPAKNIYFPFKKDFNNLLSEYTNSFKEIASPGSSFFFFMDDPGSLLEILAIINKAEEMIENDSPHIYNILKEAGVIWKKDQELLLKIGLYEEQLNSLDNYHVHNISSDSRYKRQITELLNFYKNEYEILPSWYKRFGHIIKVIMGKRTFLSLFKDNVKKYKE